MKIRHSDVIEVLRYKREGWTRRQLAEHFHVTVQAIGAILLGESHRDISPDDPIRRACVRAERARRNARRRQRGKGKKGQQRRNKKLKANRTKKLNSAVRNYYREKFSIRAAAKRNGISPSALHRELARQRIRRRGNGQRSPQYKDARKHATTIEFVIACLFRQAIDLEELRAWADHVLLTAPSCPNYVTGLSVFDGCLKDVFGVIGFVPRRRLSLSEQAAVLGIAYTRGRELFDPPVPRPEALSALERHPGVLDEFRITFPFLAIGPTGPGLNTSHQIAK